MGCTVDILDFDHVAEQYATLLTLADRTVVLIFIEYDTGESTILRPHSSWTVCKVLGMSRLC